jgi:hypothetical protein
MALSTKTKEVHTPSPTAIAAEALRTGVAPQPENPRRRPVEIPGEEDTLLVGDPGQDRVDDIGRAYGVQEVDSGALKPAAEILDERDRHRPLLEVPDQNR